MRKTVVTKLAQIFLILTSIVISVYLFKTPSNKNYDRNDLKIQLFILTKRLIKNYSGEGKLLLIHSSDNLQPELLTGSPGQPEILQELPRPIIMITSAG